MLVDRVRLKSVILGHPVRWIIAVLVIGWASVANAAPENGIVLESYTGERHPDASRLLSPVLDELATRGYIAGPDVIGRRFEQRASRASMTTTLPANFADQVEQGHKAYISGRFADAVKILSPLVDNARTNPASFANAQPLRDKLLKGLIALALSHHRNGDADAAKLVFDEIIQTFPGTSLSRQSYGPEAFSLFEDLKKQAAAKGTGTLVVKATNDTGVVFINERFASPSGNARETLIPGTYRVFVQVGKKASRLHTAVVTRGEETVVEIDPEFDQQVHSGPEWTGFAFPSTEDREARESRFAAYFASQLAAKGVVVIGIETVRGKPAVVASLVLLNGVEIRRASVPLDPDPSIDRLRTLGRFAGGENVTDGIDVDNTRDPKTVEKANVPVRTSELRVPRGDPMWGGWKWLTGAAGVGALGVGAYLLSVDGDCTDAACTYNRETSVSGWVTLSGGIVLTGISIYLFVRGDGDDTPDRGAFVVPARGGAYAGYALRF